MLPFRLHISVGKAFEVTENFCAQSILANNDINAIGVIILVHRRGSGKKLDVQLRVRDEFGEFLFDTHHVLKAVNPQKAKARTLAPFSFKAFDMNLPFEMGNIDPKREPLFKSHKERSLR